MKVTQIEPVYVGKNVQIELTPEEAGLLMKWMLFAHEAHQAGLDRQSEGYVLSASTSPALALTGRIYALLVSLGYGE